MENLLKTIVTTKIVPAELTITYDDMHGLWGGTTIAVRGDRSMQTQLRETGDGKTAREIASEAGLTEVAARL